MIQVKINKLPKSEIEIEGELPAETVEAYFPKALAAIGANIEMDGFRKGKVPENILLAKIGEMGVLEEVAEMALGENYPKILEENKIDAIGRPEIAITKLARNNPLGFKIKTAVLPEMTLPDYKNIAKEVVVESTAARADITVTDEEIENTIIDIRKSRAPKIKMAESAEIAKEGEDAPAKGGDADTAAPEQSTDADVAATEGTKKALAEASLPEWNDEFVRSLGPFADIADFTTKLKENLKLEKENQAKEKMRITIIEKIIDATKADLPEILIESEIEKIIYRMESDITAMGLKMEDYLNHLKKTKEDLRKDFRKDAEKKAMLSLVLHKISQEEKLEADQELVAKEVAHILEHYKDADPERARMHAENVLTNERVFQFLEGQS
ncbi:MAG TPA: trigger factor [Candidatus Paceibacterota bacterium]|nr:trigger factor [Candidatus Paceibacterota bacterium]